MHQHFKLYKPYRYISQFISNQQKSYKKNFLGELYPFPESTMAIGRLDEKSEGLLLLTTNGKMSEYIRSNRIEKEYFVLVDGVITEQAIKKLSTGVTITVNKKPYTTQPCQVFSITPPPVLPHTKQQIRDCRHGPSSWISITLTEGKFRQVRKMTASVGFPTLRLVRVRIGSISIKGMEAGDCKPIELRL